MLYASAGQFAPPYYPAELLKPQQPQPQYVQAINANGERVMVLLQQPQPQPRPVQPQPIQLPLGAGGGLTLAQLQQLQLQQQQQQQQQLRAPQLLSAPQARGLAPAAPAHHHAAAQPQQLYILTSAGLQSVGGGGTSLPLHTATHTGLPPRPAPAQPQHHLGGGQPILLPAQSGAPPQLRPAGQPVQLATSLPAGAQYLNLAAQHLQPAAGPAPLQLGPAGGARLGGGAGAAGGTGALLHASGSLPFSSGLTAPQVLPLPTGQAAPPRHHPGHPLQLHQLLQARSNPPRSSPVPAQQPQVVQLQPPPHTDLMLLLQRQQQQQQQQHIASLQARVASLNSGQGPQQRTVTSLPLTSSALMAAPNGVSAGLPVHSGGLPVSSAGLPASLLQPLRAQQQQQQQQAPPGSADQQRIDQSLFLAQLVAQQQQQQQRLGRSPRSSTGTPPLALQSAALQNHRNDLTHLPLEDDDHIVFSEQRRPAPRNTSAPALHPNAGNRQLPQTLGAPGGLQPPQLLELKTASSDTNLQHHVNGSEASKGAPAAASNSILHDPAATAAAAATAALTQPINHVSNSKGPTPAPPAAALPATAGELGGDAAAASKAADGGLGNLSSILLSIGVELARHGISVETAVGAGWLGVLSPADVRLLHDAYTSEVQRLQMLHAAPPTANGNAVAAPVAGAAQGAPDTWSQGVQRLGHTGAPNATGTLSLHQSQLLQLLQPHVGEGVREGAGAEQLSAVVEHVCREQGVARGSMDAALATLGADAVQDAPTSPAPKPLADTPLPPQLSHAKENGLDSGTAVAAATAAGSADANDGGAGVLGASKEGGHAAAGSVKGGGVDAAGAAQQQEQQQQQLEQHESKEQKEREQADLQQQLDAGNAERAQLEQQLLAASPAQFSAFEYGFFAPPEGAGNTELMECLEDLNQNIFDASGLGDNKDQEGEQQSILKTQDEEPLTQLPNTTRDSDEEGPSNHELAARFANLDLGSGFF